MNDNKLRELILRKAEEHGITLTHDDFDYENGFLLIDGMDADQWLEAMISE